MVLKFGLLIVKMLCNGKSMSSNVALMPVANKVSQKVKKFILRIFRKNATDDYPNSFLDDIVFQCL